MKKKLLLSSLFCLSVCFANAAYVPVAVTGFNADVIAEGTGTSLSKTTNDVDGVSWVFVANQWQYAATNTPYSGGLPLSGLITSPLTTGLTYQLASYTGNNVLRINTSSAPATLTMVSQLTAQNVYVLSTSGSGSCVMTAQVNFTDNTNQQFTSLTVNDWFNNTPFEIGQIGRLTRDAVTTVPENQTLGPRLYRHVLAISAANQSKQIASIQFTRTSGTGILNIYAVSMETTITCAAPTALTATPTTTTASLNWTNTGTPIGYQIKYGPAGFNLTTGGTAIYTTTKPYTLNPPLTQSTSYDYYVRSVCAVGDTSLWSVVKNFSTTCDAPSVVSKKDSFNCGPGTVMLEATTTTGSSIKWYTALTGGTAVATGNTYTTPSITANTTYYISAVNGTCESTPRQPVVATIRPFPTVNLGNDTSICPGVSYTFNAGNPGATYAWNTTETTQTITKNTAGTFSVLVTLNKCSMSDAINIVPGAVPVNILPAITNLCEGDVVNLNAGNTGSTFTWTPSAATTQTINVSTGGINSVVIKSVDGCKITSSTNVTLRPLPVASLGNDTSICESATITLDAGNPGYTYLWNTNAVTQTIDVTDSGTYSVLVTTPYNCVNTEEKHVAFLPSPRVEGFNFIPLFYEELGKVRFAPLNPTSVNTYEWDFGDGSTTSIAVNPTHTYSAGGQYIVTLKVFNNCSDYSISLPIHVNLATGIVTLGGNEAEVVLYPNPSSTELTIANKTDNVKMEDVKVFNILGALVYQHSADSDKQHKLSVASLPSGMYSVRILTNKGFVIRKFEVIK